MDEDMYRERSGFMPGGDIETVARTKEWRQVLPPPCLGAPLSMMPSCYLIAVEVSRRVKGNTLNLGNLSKDERWDIVEESQGLTVGARAVEKGWVVEAS